ncbi:MAG: hypothetical protein A3F31_05490 [Candidatus Levybacteria bacterium RIFCSPHIGHO2_12_FULL_38_12]|nr:MAG: hypothetical protein A3F31_05490 [Candidatus Levybacteria bacterium RIFCSPHIGHO2_12_FULL_38_12]OGH44381.1 MAG: hypothetical protein A3J14_02255 [Candidatus Levybacteria bacterium RIFCSPLOWO2_02_FULL_37_18]
MILVTKLPEKVQFLTTFSFPLVKRLCQKTKGEQFVGGRKGYDGMDIVKWIVGELSAKASIPIRKKSKLAKGKTGRYGNYENRFVLYERVTTISIL